MILRFVQRLEDDFVQYDLTHFLIYKKITRNLGLGFGVYKGLGLAIRV